jgi:hypothetical protein
MRYAAIASLSFMLFASSAVSQQAPASPSATIEGLVTRMDTGAPVAGAQVTLTVLNPLAASIMAGADPAVIIAQQAAQPIAQTPPPQIPPINTDAEGKFAFKNLAAGTYRVIAVANGFVRQEYGQRSQNGQGMPLPLAANQNMKDVALRLTPAGTVSGRILDENGQPALGIPVQLLRQTYNATGRTYQAVGAAAADDRGQYRLFGVPPGRYYLNIGNPPGPIRMVAPAGGGVIGGQLAGGTAYAFSYFPGVADASQAVMIEVKSGQEVSFRHDSPTAADLSRARNVVGFANRTTGRWQCAGLARVSHTDGGIWHFQQRSKLRSGYWQVRTPECHPGTVCRPGTDSGGNANPGYFAPTNRGKTGRAGHATIRASSYHGYRS